MPAVKRPGVSHELAAPTRGSTSGVMSGASRPSSSALATRSTSAAGSSGLALGVGAPATSVTNTRIGSLRTVW